MTASNKPEVLMAYRKAVIGRRPSNSHSQHASKFVEVRPRVFRVMPADRQTDRQTNILITVLCAPPVDEVTSHACLYAQSHSITALWLVLTSRPAEGRRLSGLRCTTRGRWLEWRSVGRSVGVHDESILITSVSTQWTHAVVLDRSS